MMFAAIPVAQAGGAGACVAGNGFDFTADQVGVFVGVNAGQNSETGVFTDQGGFEAACCAENNQPPDCFNPV
ncbi:MAG: hypothetical protein LC624_08995 [Halobacteriales archaeon]|nr:hypothetical protein [Halobacteriales archaeon]